LATGAYLYPSGTHQLASVGNAARTNDANGNTTDSVVGGETFGFGYNGRNRLAVAQRNGQTVGTYTYNALGQRIGKVATFPQAVTEHFAYDEASRLIGEYGTTDRDYVWLGDIPVAVIDNTTSGSVTTSVMNYVITDQLGTPRAVSDGTGMVIWSWAYQGNPFGEQQPTSATGYVLNLRYPGQYFDAESGTNYNVFRTYESATGRYLQPDPMGQAAGPSLYAYVEGDPMSVTDPLGLLAYIARNGNSITINLPIAFSGGTQEQYDMMARAISSHWTGRFGNYCVTTNVIDGSKLSGFDTNYVSVLPGNGMATAEQTGGLSQTKNHRFGEWYGVPTRRGGLDYAHEGGHLMGLGEWNDAPNLMNQYITTPEVTPALIEAILESPGNVTFHH
jgi:RHS repeat-associated protein